MKRLLSASWRKLAGLTRPSMSVAGFSSGVPSTEFPREHALSPIRMIYVRTDGIGDALLSAGFLAAVGSAFPHWNISVVCPASSSAVFTNHPFVEEVHTFDLQSYRSSRRAHRSFHAYLAGLQPDLVLNGVRSRYSYTDRISLEMGAPIRIAISDPSAHMPLEIRREADRRYTHLYRMTEANVSEMDLYQGLLKWMGIDRPYPGPVMSTQEEDDRWAEAFLEREDLDPSRVVLLFAGALHDIRYARQYGPALRQAEIGDVAVLAVGAAKDRLICEENLRSSGRRSANLCGTTTLGQCAALMKRARLAVGAETGLAHMACAVGLPQAVILGGGHFGRFMPYSPLTTFAAVPLDCFGCGWACRYPTIHCIKDLPVSTLAMAIEHAWSQGRTQPSPTGILARPLSGPHLCGPLPVDLREQVWRPCRWIESP